MRAMPTAARRYKDIDNLLLSLYQSMCVCVFMAEIRQNGALHSFFSLFSLHLLIKQATRLAGRQASFFLSRFNEM